MPCTRIALALALAAALTAVAPAAFAQSAAAQQGLPRTPSVPDARVYIISPAAGETLTSPVRVRFGLVGMGVAPAGVERASTGHHHLLIDTGLPAFDAPVPADGQHLHFGGGQTETELKLEPGTHTLQLVLADHLHIPHDPPLLSERIQIKVR